jgi:hypothetical protein
MPALEFESSGCVPNSDKGQIELNLGMLDGVLYTQNDHPSERRYVLILPQPQLLSVIYKWTADVFLHVNIKFNHCYA